MGDNVKITVIATGFRQDQLGRRSRSGSDAVPHVSLLDKPRVPRFASEEAAEFSPLFESRKVSQHPAPPAAEKHTVMEVSPEPIMMGEARVEEARSAAPARVPVIHASFEEPFEEEYARLMPSQPVEHELLSSARAEGVHIEHEPAMENLDIPAFLRRPVN
jgi:hypothetical protein